METSHIKYTCALNYLERATEEKKRKFRLQEKGSKMKENHKFRRLFAIISFAIVGFVSTTVQGQMEFMAEAMQPEYFSRDLVVFAEGLNLDDTQEVIVEAMFDSYEDEFELGFATFQERVNRIADELREAPPTTSRETLEPVLNALGDWLVEKQELDEGLLENIKAILINHQRLLWPGFERKLYREKHINRGKLSGESVDLFQIKRDSDFSQTAETFITETLEEYSIALDAAMRKRDAILRGNPKKLFDNILMGNAQREPAYIEDIIRARLEVRDLNDRYTEIICSSLSAEDSDNFRLRSLKRGYPRIFRITPAARILRQAAENESYDPAIIVQILQLEIAYTIELNDLNFKILTTTRRYEPEALKHREVAGQIRKNGGTPTKLEDPSRELYKEREELGKRFIDMLRAILTPEEFIELDGARRWVPRSEQPIRNTPNLGPTQGPDGLSIQSGGASGTTKKKGEKDKGRDGGSDLELPGGSGNEAKPKGE